MSKSSVLIVDDEAINRMLLKEYLLDAGYDSVEAEGGTQALEILRLDPNRFAAVLLDRMMPDMDGLSVLKEMKKSDDLKHIPVIMQTAKAMKDEIREGLECGSYYYLTKPFDKKTLLTILDAAIEQFHSHQSLIHELADTTNTLSLMSEGIFKCKTLVEARSLSKLLAISCPEPHKTVTGLNELLINAIEHGNLGITYDEKTELIASNLLYEEIDKRLQQDKYKVREVVIKYSRNKSDIVFKRPDEGKGFDYNKFLDMDLSKVLESHGRGIAMAKILSFSDIVYNDPGNEVSAYIKI